MRHICSVRPETVARQEGSHYRAETWRVVCTAAECGWEDKAGSEDAARGRGDRHEEMPMRKLP